MTTTAVQNREDATSVERRPFQGHCPPYCHGRHHSFVPALDDYHHQPLGEVGVSFDPVEHAGQADYLPESVSVLLIQHVTRDAQPYVAIDDDAGCLRFTPDQARVLAARLLQGAALLDGDPR